MKIYDVCPSLELVKEEISWEEIIQEEKILNEFDKTCKSIDDIPEGEQAEFIADMIINNFFN